uniref:Protein CR006 P-loop domain-containing protein n=1 Tax=Rhizobium leguminosarum TaxID=384 RepID=A0A154I7C1_RHILE|nr:hypothetical protein A4A59_05185 [Rhizobium leguminosarum]
MAGGQKREPSILTIQNTLRRILENYFTILGNMDRDDIVNEFAGQEQQICNSLFSWVNDGSHSALEDLYLACDAATVDGFLQVFKKIFEVSGHSAHYDMMIAPRQLIKRGGELQTKRSGGPGGRGRTKHLSYMFQVDRVQQVAPV